MEWSYLLDKNYKFFSFFLLQKEEKKFFFFFNLKTFFKILTLVKNAPAWKTVTCWSMVK